MMHLISFLMLPWRDHPAPRPSQRRCSPRLRFARIALAALRWTPPRGIKHWVNALPSRHHVDVALYVRGTWYELNLGSVLGDDPTRSEVWFALDRVCRCYRFPARDPDAMEGDIVPIRLPSSRRIDCGGEGAP